MQTQLLQEETTAWLMQLMVSAAAATAAAAPATAAAAGSGEDVQTALNPVLVPDTSVCILTVMVVPVLVKGPGMKLPRLSLFPL